MARFAEPMTRLIDELRKLPGIGTKNAQRLAFHVLRSSDADARALADAILVLRAKLHLCSICNNITDVDPCGYCTSAIRDQHILCIVEEPTNIATIEKTRSYNGVYHVLHGTLSPIGGIGPEQLRIANLLTRLTPPAFSSNGSAGPASTTAEETPDGSVEIDPIALNAEVLDPYPIREVILATSPTTEGEATAAFLADEIHRIAPGLRVTRIATGVPAGSDIEYADEVTMTRALEGRRDF
ncbi:MAG: recombination protein RecR [Acidobacteriota bacterium]|nr:recombination protein RecR [Acidobacteriota bacterium]